MKKILLTNFLLLLMVSCHAQKEITSDFKLTNQVIITEDLKNFWQAYDAIQVTDDTIKQLSHLKTLFIIPASEGQKRMMESRNYLPKDYLQSIKDHPKFWNSIRANMENLDHFNNSIKTGVDKLAKIYPSLKPSKIFYTVGTHRSPGTGVDKMVLIGTEFALGDSITVTDELPLHFQNYYRINPVNYLQFLSVHEYVHTQQSEMVHDLLSLTLYEGIAEFIAIKATNTRSPWKAFTYGPEHEQKIKNRFEQDIFKENMTYSWLWNSTDNIFQTSEIGYYVGYQIANLYYNQQEDKEAAIKNLIELDYKDKAAVEALVNSTQYFNNTLKKLEENFESHRPSVVNITQLTVGDDQVDSNLKMITVNFSEPMHTETRGFDYGPLGEKNVLRVQKIIGFSEDKKSFSFTIELNDNQRYQSMVTKRFQSEKGFPLKPYLIDFKTKAKKQLKK